MNTATGTFIVIEGTDGSGKGTQFKLLAERLAKAGYDVATFDFPQYDHPSSYFVREYLNGSYGSNDEVGPYTASLFYALDRYEVAPKIRAALEAGKIVLANRFVGSNMAHQGTKFANIEERRGYFIWLDNLEFEMLHIPRPTVSFVLRVPAGIAQQLVDKKEQRNYTDKKRDIHEADLSHLERSVSVYDEMCELFPHDFTRIDCVRNGQLMDIETIQRILWDKIDPLLPMPIQLEMSTPAIAAARSVDDVTEAAIVTQDTPEDTSPAYLTPGNFDAETRAYYQTALHKILETHAYLVETLTTHLSHASQNKPTNIDQEAIRAQVRATTDTVLPVASVATRDSLAEQSPDIAELARQYLPENYAAETHPVQLTDYWPRNEFELVPDFLYESSSLPLRTIRDSIASWPYAQKATIFEAYFGGNSQNKPLLALQKTHYNWDIISSYAIFRNLTSEALQADNLEWQQLTPRYGYDMPKIIEDAGLENHFESCFDISLQLHSYLHQAGFTHEAQYATLLGHRMRWSMTVNGQGMRQLLTHDGAQDETIQPLITAMSAHLAEVHPLTSALAWQAGDKS